ncbi:MAG: hypothetical protein M3245_05615 [Actinomycetota bacterium]|nr:hypothetical protein [Actinomycetota bacterium]
MPRPAPPPKTAHRIAGLTVALSLLSVSAVRAGDVHDPDVALARARGASSRLQRTAEAIRADLTSGSFERVAVRMAAMAGVDPAPLGGVEVASIDLTALPPGMAGGVADLLSAATSVAGRIRAATDADDGASRRLSERAGRLGHRIALALATGKRLPVDEARRLKRRVTASPVLRAAAAGGLEVGAALDRSLDALRISAATLAPSDRPAAACDVVDERPLLCVGGTGPNATDAEAVLVVDLGGDDTYTSSAGGANSARCVDDPDDTSCNASVLVDLGGDDTYLLGESISHDHLVGAGSALLGVGVLVDVAGSDRYLAHVPGRDDSLDISFAFGSADLGLGLLADLAGNDRYEWTSAPRDTWNPYTHGSSLTGMGALLDLDGTNVYRTVVSGPQPPSPGTPLAANEFISSMAVGIFGGAAVVDRTGHATMDARIHATAGVQDDHNLVNPIAYGAGLVGDAAMLTGPGPTTYSAIARRVATASLAGQSSDPQPDPVNGGVPPAAILPGGAHVTAHAIGVLGTGIIDDRGGDDAYLAHARSEHRLTVTAAKGCGCDRAIATIDVSGGRETYGVPFDAAAAGVSAQGIGSSLFVPDAGALLHDHGGDDAYVARAELVIAARARNLLPGGSRGARAEAVPFAVPEVSAFGQGLGSDFSPTVLQDDAGDDRYVLTALTRSDAFARAGDGPAASRSVAGTTATHGQGASYWDPAHGALLDLGGRDVYAARSLSRASTWPNAGALDSTRTIAAQGAVGGVLADLDEALTDRFSAAPELGPGVGVRGEGPGWVDVSRTFPGYGVTPDQPARRTASLELDPQNPASASGGMVPFRARLTEGGPPLAGREVTFDLEYRSGVLGPVGERWVPHRFSAHGITDAQGWVTGHLDIEEFAESWGDPGEIDLRVAARYHGDPETSTALATQPFRLGG